MCINFPGILLAKDHFVYASSQWEATLQCNVVSHWLAHTPNDHCLFCLHKHKSRIVMAHVMLIKTRHRPTFFLNFVSNEKSYYLIYFHIHIQTSALHTVDNYIKNSIKHGISQCWNIKSAVRKESTQTHGKYSYVIFIHSRCWRS